MPELLDDAMPSHAAEAPVHPGLLNYGAASGLMGDASNVAFSPHTAKQFTHSGHPAIESTLSAILSILDAISSRIAFQVTSFLGNRE